MPPQVVNLADKLGQFNDHWAPRIVAQMNDCHFKVAKIHGDFVWHSHADTDEAFLVVDGTLRIDFRDGPITLQSGDLCIVPRGVEHKPYAEQECHILLFESVGTINTGNALPGARTASAEEWI